MQEAEQLADRIGFINKGEIVDTGKTEKVKMGKFSTYEMLLKVKNIRDKAFLKKHGFVIRGNTLAKMLRMDENIREVVGLLVSKKYEITDIVTRKPTLEDYFVKILAEKRGDAQ